MGCRWSEAPTGVPSASTQPMLWGLSPRARAVPPGRRLPASGFVYFRKKGFVAQIRSKWRGAEPRRAKVPEPTSALWLTHQLPRCLQAAVRSGREEGNGFQPGRPELQTPDTETGERGSRRDLTKQSPIPWTTGSIGEAPGRLSLWGLPRCPSTATLGFPTSVLSHPDP